MKTIVIHPEIIAYHNSSFRDPRPPLNKALIAGAILLPLVAFGGWLAGRSTNSAPAVSPTAPAPLALAAPAIPRLLEVPDDGSVELETAVENGLLKADFISNGRDHLSAELANPGAQPLKVRVSFGQMFESGRNTVIVTRTSRVEIAPGKSATLSVPTAATRSANRIVAGPYRLSNKTTPRIDLLLTYAQDHPELAPPVLQTAILALTENLPVSALCKFIPAGADEPSRFDTTAFRVETLDLLAALTILRELGVRDRNLALTVDPQLRIEAMIDPACRATAMNYYHITSGAEWTYWKSELLDGDPGTRHYALYGIARFYPEIALEMLPKWAREKRTTPIFRLTAVQALAETQRSEALPILSDLVNELGRNTELGRAALSAAQLLDSSLRKASQNPHTVAFRGTVGAGPF